MPRVRRRSKLRNTVTPCSIQLSCGLKFFPDAGVEDEDVELLREMWMDPSIRQEVYAHCQSRGRRVPFAEFAFGKDGEKVVLLSDMPALRQYRVDL